MRIAVTSSHRNVIGGIETYLRALLPGLAGRGHEVAFWHEDAAAGGETIDVQDGASVWSVSEFGAERALRELHHWRPDIIYAQGLKSPSLEAATQGLAPSVFFAHAYYGACVSGTKTHGFPRAAPCERGFGWQCLMHYYPRRCGGLSPLTMLRDYREQAARLALLKEYRAILVASAHMAREYARYGLSGRTSVVGLPLPTGLRSELEPRAETRQRERWRILFLARMESLKGGEVLLDALPLIARGSRLPVRVTFAGEGRLRGAWERRAARLVSGTPGLEADFTGWLGESERDRALRDSDLLVMPSVWPEPFGLAGTEAGLYGLPVVAFAVGGIPDWLMDGVNGRLAEEGEPRAVALAKAVLDCTRDEDVYRRLSRGAIEQARCFNMEAHLTALEAIFERVRKGV